MSRAPHYCPGGCRTLIPAGQRRCDDCARTKREREARQGGSWGSGRTGLPHKQFRESVLARDRHCQLRYEGCQGIPTIAGHIVPVAAGGITDAEGRNGRGECANCAELHTKKERAYLQWNFGERPWPIDDKSLFAPPEPPQPVGRTGKRRNAPPSGLVDKASQTLRPAIGVDRPQREQSPQPTRPPADDGPAWDAPLSYLNGGTEHSFGRPSW
jgi:5-methylcytosine-specific restriction enzyme A